MDISSQIDNFLKTILQKGETAQKGEKAPKKAEPSKAAQSTVSQIGGLANVKENTFVHAARLAMIATNALGASVPALFRPLRKLEILQVCGIEGTCEELMERAIEEFGLEGKVAILNEIYFEALKGVRRVANRS